MILASHQPNFIPYPGFFYKMYCCDVFSLSTGVKFSRNGYHNFNFIAENGVRAKVTIPVSSHTERICNVYLSDWERTRKKLMKRIAQDYRCAPHHIDVLNLLETAMDPTFTLLVELNKSLLEFIYDYFDMDCLLVDEMGLELEYKSPNEDIISIAKQTGCDRYLSGTGAKEYLNETMVKQHGVEALWSKYQTIDYGSTVEDASIIDYMMLKGREVPDLWKKDREAYHEGI